MKRRHGRLLKPLPNCWRGDCRVMWLAPRAGLEPATDGLTVIYFTAFILGLRLEFVSRGSSEVERRTTEKWGEAVNAGRYPLVVGSTPTPGATVKGS